MKRFVSLVLLVSIILPFECVMPVKADSADTAIEARINELYDLLGNKYFTTDQKSAGSSSDRCLNSNVIKSDWFVEMFGISNLSVSQFPGSPRCTAEAWSCSGFASFAGWYIFKNSNTDNVRINELSKMNYTYSNVVANAKIGDIVSLSGTKYDTSGVAVGTAGHEFIFISADSNGAYVLDSNWGNDCKVTKHYIRYSYCDYFQIGRVTTRDDVTSSDVYYTVTLKGNGGTPSSRTITVAKGSSTVLTYPTAPTGYECNGWFTAAEGGEFVADGWSSYTVTTSMTLYAHWRPDDYDIVYDANGGTGAPNNQTKYHDEDFYLSTKVPTRSGYTFLGWSTSKTSTVATYQPGDYLGVNSDIVLYAVWKENVFQPAMDTSCAQDSAVGDTIKIIVFFPAFTAAKSGSFNLVYDNTKMELVDAEAGDYISDCAVINETYAENKVRISFANDDLMLPAGASEFLTATFKLTASGTAKFSTEKFKLATINAVSLNCENISKSIVISEATVAVTGVTLNKSTLSLTVGGSATLTTAVAPTNATNKAVTWKSSNTSVATVSNGKVTAKSAGTATITVTTADGSKTATCKVTVKEATVAVTGVSLNKSTLSLTEGESETLTATVTPSDATNKKITWSSSNSNVLSMEEIIYGDANNDGIVDSEDADYLRTLLAEEKTDALDAKTKFAIDLNKDDNISITDLSLINLIINGEKSYESACIVTAKGAGTATITATTAEGNKTATCTVNVVVENLITNGDFSAGNTTGWTNRIGTAITGATVAYDDEIEGNVMSVQTLGKASTQSIGTVWNVEQGKTYKLSFDIGGSKPEANNYQYNRVTDDYAMDGSSYTCAGNELIAFGADMVDGQWNHFEKVFKATTNIVYIQSSWLVGEMKFANFELCEVESFSGIKYYYENVNNVLAETDGSGYSKFTIFEDVRGEKYYLKDDSTSNSTIMDGVMYIGLEKLGDAFTVQNGLIYSGFLDDEGLYPGAENFAAYNWGEAGTFDRIGFAVVTVNTFYDNYYLTGDYIRSFSSETTPYTTLWAISYDDYLALNLSDTNAVLSALKDTNIVAQGECFWKTTPLDEDVVDCLLNEEGKIVIVGSSSTGLFGLGGEIRVVDEYAEIEGICGDNLTWNISGDTLTISGTGDMYDYEYYSASKTMPWNSFVHKINRVVIEEGVTSIGSYAFCEFRNLTNVVIPETVERIHRYAFLYCTSLTELKLPSSLTEIQDYAFDVMSSLKSIEIPEGVTTLPYGAFFNCRALTTVTIPKSLKKIDEYAFYGCSVETVYYDGSATGWSGVDINEIGNSSFISADVQFAEDDDAIWAINGQNTNSVHALPEAITDKATVAFTMNATNAPDTLIALNDGSKMTGNGYFAASQCMFSINNGYIRYYNGGNINLISIKYGKDYEFVVDVDVSNQTYSFTITDADGKVTKVENAKFRTTASVVDSLVLLDNADANYGTSIRNLRIVKPEVETAKLAIGNVAGSYGETVTIPVTIDENPGLAGFKLKINFDNTVLEPVSIEKGSILTAGTLTSNIQQSEDVSSLTYVSAYWSNPSNVESNGELLNVAFKIKDGVELGLYPVTVTYESGDVTNQNFEEIGFEITNGSVNVLSVVMGDLFNDGKVNTKDGVKLSQYLADWDVTFTEYEKAAADVFKDGKINTKDGVKLSQYLADWDVELMELMEIGSITFEAGSAEAVDGYVDLPVTITENNGVAGFKVKLNYDNALLTPVSVTKGDALTVGTMTTNVDEGGDLSNLKAVSVYWSNPSNVKTTGVAFTVRFKVADGVSEDIPVTLSYEEGDICDQSFNDLNVTLKDGSISAMKAMDYTITSLAGVVVDGSFYAEAEITKNTDRDATDTIVIAVYKDNVLVDRLYMRSKFANGQKVVFGGYLQGYEGATLKAFVWDDMTSMNALSNVLEK